MIKEISIRTKFRNQMLDISKQLSDFIRESSIKEGTCMVYIPHTTAAITINENADPLVPKDVLKKLEALIPKKDNYEHLEGNSDSHLKAILVGFSVMIPVFNGRLCLGTWQGVFFCEFDGPRNRKAILKII